jgi:hypothetical protein
VSSLRRSLLLVAAAVAVLVGLTGPAQAAFNGKATMAPLTVTTTTVAAPTNLSAAGTWCDTATLHARLSWTPSASPKVSGYTLTAYAGTTVVESLTVPAGQNSFGIDISRSYPTSAIQVTVTAQTTYGWTKESAKTRTGTFTC